MTHHNPDSGHAPALSRRRLLAAAPVAAIVAATPALAQASRADTPVMRQFREWEAHHAWLESDEASHLSEEAFDRECVRQSAMEDAIIATPAETAANFVATVVAYTGFGTFALPYCEDNPALWAEAKALIWRDARIKV